jgi:hypothetical protein
VHLESSEWKNNLEIRYIIFKYVFLSMEIPNFNTQYGMVLFCNYCVDFDERVSSLYSPTYHDNSRSPASKSLNNIYKSTNQHLSICRRYLFRILPPQHLYGSLLKRFNHQCRHLWRNRATNHAIQRIHEPKLDL